MGNTNTTSFHSFYPTNNSRVVDLGRKLSAYSFDGINRDGEILDLCADILSDARSLHTSAAHNLSVDMRWVCHWIADCGINTTDDVHDVLDYTTAELAEVTLAHKLAGRN